MQGVQVRTRSLADPLGGEVQAVDLYREGRLKVSCLPDRALDIYELCCGSTRINPLNPDAGLSGEHFVEDGVEGFQRNFFIGMLTTCGLIQSGRPCNENGRAFGLHGCISNTPARELTIELNAGQASVCGTMLETHPQGERMELKRRITLFADDRLRIEDRVRNCGREPTPFMMMYHINFGAPFLSAGLRMRGDWSYIEERDSGRSASAAQLCEMHPRGAFARERVYYTRCDLLKGVLLEQAEWGLSCRITAQGSNLRWMGVWKNFSESLYALGIEPCNCPGLGRVNAAARGLLEWLEPGEVRENQIQLQFNW